MRLIMMAFIALIFLSSCERQTEPVNRSTAKVAVVNFDYDDDVESAIPDASTVIEGINLLGGGSVFADGKRVGFFKIQEPSEVALPEDARTISFSMETRYKTGNPNEWLYSEKQFGFVDVSKFKVREKIHIDCKFDFLKSITQIKEHDGDWAIECVALSSSPKPSA